MNNKKKKLKMHSTQISEQNTSKKREEREGRRGNKTSSSGEYMTNFELRKTGGVCSSGSCPQRSTTTLVIEAWKIQSVAHLVHFARKMQSRRGMLTHGAAVCLPGTDLQWSLAKSRWLTRLSLPLSGSHPAKAQAGPVLHLVILFSL